MPTVTAILREDKINKHGTAPIYLRFSDRNRSTFASLGIRIRPSEWNDRTRTVRKSHPQADALNSLIKTRLAEAGTEIVRLKTARTVPSAHNIKAAVIQESSHDDFYRYAAAVADEFKTRGSVQRALKIGTLITRLREIAPGPLPYDGLTPALLKALETHLLAGIGNQVNTVRVHMGVLRSVLYRAIREGKAEQSKNPFFSYKIPKEVRPERQKLTMGELLKIEALDLPPDTLIWRVRAYFLFSFYCAGIRFGDLARLTHEHLKHDEDGFMRLQYRMNKTSGLKSLRLLPQAVAVLDGFPKRPGSAFLLPILDNYDLSTATKLRSAISSQTALANKYLKKIADLAGIKYPVTTHIARHSFADIARKAGWDVYTISKALGHASLKVTESYLSGFDSDELDSKMLELLRGN